ncbi:hypothetical protein R1flu_017731 [Riccia fluitans]|uniref:Alcohol dehydrogenase n=1 Tax=Riccia fluitans TaxID=41844 RepID=A0ABD1ZDW0_9MARC
MATEGTQPCTICPKVDETRFMKALEWHGKKDVRVNAKRPMPLVTDPGDVVLQVTSTCICGSDLHLYLGNMLGMQSGDVLGHEFMGVVHDVGPDVKNLKKGDRVVACFDIACGQCYFCSKLHLFTCCDNTNPSKDMKDMYGDQTAGFFGYSHLTGGYPGGQAEYVRVPFADTNTLLVPENTPDEKLVFLSDIVPTAWHANELGEVGEGDNVAIWGCGPVGMLTARFAQIRGAKEVILIDSVKYRLDCAKEKLPGVHTINFKEVKVYDALRKIFPHGPDVGIDAVGMHYASSLIHKMQMMTMLETDTPEILNDIIFNVRKGGRISVIGAYGGFTNHFNIGAFMEKSQTMRGGQTPVQKYWKYLLELIQEGKLDPTMVITHQKPLEDGPEMYKTFNEKIDHCMKVVLHPGSTQ